MDNMANQTGDSGIGTSLNEDKNDVFSPPEDPRHKVNGVPVTYHVKIPKYKIKLDCETTGSETILEMLKRSVKESSPRHKPKFEYMLFKNSADEYLNVGLPSGVLKESETYTCIFKDYLVYNTTDLIRKYDVTEFSNDWDMKHFYVLFDQHATPSMPNVSPLQKVIQGKIRVDFFAEGPCETLFEALMRDGRFCRITSAREFDKQVLRRCNVLCDGSTFSSHFSAGSYEGKTLQLYDRKTVNEALGENVDPRGKPYSHSHDCADAFSVPVKSMKNERSNSFVTLGTQSPLAASTPVRERKIRLSSDEDLEQFIKKMFGLETQKQEKAREEKKRQNNIKKFLNVRYENFALTRGGFFCAIIEHRRIATVSESVGAIIIVNGAGVPEVIGTCFRTGTKYVLTNGHVARDIKRATLNRPSDVMYVDFNYESADGKLPAGRKHFFEDDFVLTKSVDMDYAVLSLRDNADELPSCLSAYGFSIPPPGSRHLFKDRGLSLTLIGHPGGQPKQTDLICPLGTADLVTLDDAFMMSIKCDHQDPYDKGQDDLKDPRKLLYQLDHQIIYAQETKIVEKLTLNLTKIDGIGWPPSWQ